MTDSSESWRFQYRCRRCGEEPRGVALAERATEQRARLMMAAAERQASNLSSKTLIYLILRHDCADGGLGLADLIGAENEERDG